MIHACPEGKTIGLPLLVPGFGHLHCQETRAEVSHHDRRPVPDRAVIEFYQLDHGPRLPVACLIVGQGDWI